MLHPWIPTAGEYDATMPTSGDIVRTGRQGRIPPRHPRRPEAPLLFRAGKWGSFR